VILFFLGCAFLSALIIVGAFLGWLGLLPARLSDSALLASLFSPLLIFGLGAVGVYLRAGSRGVSDAKRLVGSLAFAAVPLLAVGLYYLVGQGQRASVQLHHRFDTEWSRSVRDSARLGDLVALKRGLKDFHQQRPGAGLGEPRTVYLSVPDSDPSCGNLGMPELPKGWRYHCVPGTNTGLSNGTGWIPVDFTAKSGQREVAYLYTRLPVDPINTIESGHFYQLSVDEQGGWILQARFATYEYASHAGKSHVHDDTAPFIIEDRTVSFTGPPPQAPAQERLEETRPEDPPVSPEDRDAAPPTPAPSPSQPPPSVPTRTTYRVVDARGNTHYTDDPASVPNAREVEPLGDSGRLSRVSPGAPLPPSTPAPTQAASDDRSGDEPHWRQRFRDAHALIAEREAAVAGAQKQIQEFQATADSPSSRCRLEQLPGEDKKVRVCEDGMQVFFDLTVARNHLKETQSQLRLAREALDDLEREASHKSVPRHWRR
jgi:hypothetical protein